MNVTIGLSKASSLFSDIPKLFEETRRSLRYRNVLELQQVMDMEELLPDAPNELAYPFHTEKEFIQALRMGMEPEALELAQSFIQELKTKSGKELIVQQGMMQLLGSIYQTVWQSGFNPNSLYQGNNLYEQLMTIRDSEDMLRWLEANVIGPYMNELKETQSVKLKQLIERVQETIRQQYMKDISLESVADLHGVNPFNLSKAFRKMTGITFIDYLTDWRLNQAKSFLAESDMKINDIAEKVGYQVTYFNRIFKKQLQMTPSQYREKYTKPD
jgi:YesN/AraC family two-component response regulator